MSHHLFCRLHIRKPLSFFRYSSFFAMILRSKTTDILNNALVKTSFLFLKIRNLSCLYPLQTDAILMAIFLPSKGHRKALLCPNSPPPPNLQGSGGEENLIWQLTFSTQLLLISSEWLLSWGWQTSQKQFPKQRSEPHGKNAEERMLDEQQRVQGPQAGVPGFALRESSQLYLHLIS